MNNGILAEYINTLETDKFLSFNSLRLYKKDLIDFDTFIKKFLSTENSKRQFDIKSLRSEDLEEFRQWVLDQGKSTAAVNRKLTAVHGFWIWLREQGLVDRDPFTQIIRRSQFRNKRAKFLSQEEINKLLDCEVLSLREKLILELIYATGIRVGELVKLTITDVDIENQLITVQRSARFKERVIPFNQIVRSYLEQYILENSLNKNSKLLLTKRNEFVSEREIFRIVKEAATKAGLKEKISPSVIRNSFLCHMKERGAFEVLLRDLTGQKNVRT